MGESKKEIEHQAQGIVVSLQCCSVFWLVVVLCMSLSLSDAKTSKSGANVEGKLTRKRKTEKLRAEYKVPLTKEKTETELTRRG